jgi:hypothetical protein
MKRTMMVSIATAGLLAISPAAGAAETTAEPKAATSPDYCECQGPTVQLLFNPAFADDVYTPHPAGCLMISYKYMHMDMDGLRSGTSNVGLDEVGFMRGKKYSYMMIPTDMTMDMHMLMLMYGINDRFTVMAMGTYLDNRMNMLMDMGPSKMISEEPTMRIRGFGDTELRAVVKITRMFAGSLGLSLPTGSIDRSTKIMGMDFRAPYDMQLGSGTYDLKPALTYNYISDDLDWNWGAQAGYTYHMGENDNDYRLGHTVKLDAWLQRAFGPATSWLRVAFSKSQGIHGQDAEIQKLMSPSDPKMSMMSAPTPDADTGNTGGRRLEGALGVSYRVGAFNLGIEGGLPLCQDLEGLQLKEKWFLSTGVQAMF